MGETASSDGAADHCLPADYYCCLRSARAVFGSSEAAPARVAGMAGFLTPDGPKDMQGMERYVLLVM